MSTENVALLVSFLALAAAATSCWASLRQNKLDAAAFVGGWANAIRQWYSEAVDVLSEASYLRANGTPDLTDIDTEGINRCRFRLSSLIDRGRLLFPNEQGDTRGLQKASAYRGLRHPVLDPLVSAEKVLSGKMPLLAFPDKRSALIGLRREFVSSIQEIVRPEWQNLILKSIICVAHKGREFDPTLGGLFPDPSKIPPGENGIMAIASARYTNRKGRR